MIFLEVGLDDITGHGASASAAAARCTPYARGCAPGVPPDKFMAQNMQKLTQKKLISWHGSCIVHEDFKGEKIQKFKAKYPGLQVLAHYECPTDVTAAADFSGGTNDMIKFVENTSAPAYMLVTECGFSDRMRVEFPDKDFMGMCTLCPFMKQNTLALVLQALKDPKPAQVIEIDEEVRLKAERALMKMFEISKVLKN